MDKPSDLEMIHRIQEDAYLLNGFVSRKTHFITADRVEGGSGDKRAIKQTLRCHQIDLYLINWDLIPFTIIPYSPIVHLQSVPNTISN